MATQVVASRSTAQALHGTIKPLRLPVAACSSSRPQPWHPLKPGIHAPARHVWCRSSTQDKGPQADSSGSGSGSLSGQPDSDNNLLYSLGMGALWIGLSVYALVLSPDQTPYRDQIVIRLLVGLRAPDETFVVNQVYYSMMCLIGVLTYTYAALLVPGGRSGNKVPAWPFISASFVIGVFALLPYFALWKPSKDQQLPPPKEELEGWSGWFFMKGAESTVMPALLIAGSVYQIYLAATAGGAAWLGYFKLLDESRLVHVSTLDFLTMITLMPFWMYNDAEGRKWSSRDTLLPILSVVPVLGPAIYLLLRPKTDTSA